jgi:type IV secretory pathway VirB10-like protein
MHCTEHHAIRVRLLQPLAAAALIVSGLIMTPAANAQMSTPQARPEQQSPQAQPPQAQSPQAQSPQAQSPSMTISDEKLNAAAAAIGRVTSIRQSYEPKIAAAPPANKQHMSEEANDAMKKAVTDQGLSVDEYNSIIRTAQNDPSVRQKLSQRIPHSSQ